MEPFADRPHCSSLSDLAARSSVTSIGTSSQPTPRSRPIPKAWLPLSRYGRPTRTPITVVRDETADLEDSVARAARFVYLNRLCFNGLYRTNRDGHFNVPYGARGAGRLPDAAVLEAVSRCLRGVTLVAKDFSEVLGMASQGDLVYMDPPYRVASRRVFREYQAGEFSSADLNRLRSWLEKLDNQASTSSVSYADSKEGRSLGEGFNSRRVRVRRNIAGFAKHRRFAYELMISNTRPTDRTAGPTSDDSSQPRAMA